MNKKNLTVVFFLLPVTGILFYLPGLFNLVQAQKVKEEEDESSYLRAVAFAPDGKSLALGMQNGTVGIWEEAGGWTTLPGKGWLSINLAFSPDGRWLAVFRADQGEIELWDTKTKKSVKTFNPREGPMGLLMPEKLAFSADSSLFAFTFLKNIFVVRLSDFQEVVRIPREGVDKIYLIDEGKTLAANTFSGFEFYQVSDGKLLRSHKNIFGVLMPDEKRIMTGRLDIWDAQTGIKVKSRDNSESGDSTPLISPDSKMIAVNGIFDDPLVLRDMASGTVLFELLKGQVGALAFSPNSSVLAAAEKNILTFWNTATGKKISTLDVRKIEQSGAIAGEIFKQTTFNQATAVMPPQPVVREKTKNNSFPQVSISIGAGSKSLNFDRSGKLLAGCSEKEAKIWDAATGLELRTFSGFQSSCKAVVFSADGETLIGASETDKEIRFWSVSTGELIRLIAAANINTLALSRDGKLLAAAFHDNKEDDIRIWKAENGELVRSIKINSEDGYSGANVTAIAFSPDGEALASSIYGDSKIVLWNPGTGARIREVKTEQDIENISALDFSPDGKYLAAGVSQDALAGSGEIVIWKAQDFSPLHRLKGHSGSITAVAFSPNSKLLATSSQSGLISFSTRLKGLKLWNVETGKEAGEKMEGEPSALAFSPDGSVLASDGIILHDPTTGKKLRQISGQSPPKNSKLSFSPDGKLLQIGDNWIDWRNARGLPPPFPPGEIENLTYAPDRQLAAFSDDDSFGVIDTATGKILGKFPFITTELKFSPDGKILVAKSYGETDGKIAVWDAGTRKKRFELAVNEVLDIKISPRGSYLLTQSGADNEKPNTQIFDLRTGKSLTELRTRFMEDIVFDSNENVLIYKDPENVNIFSLKERKVIQKVPVHELLTQFAVSPDGKTLAIAEKVLRLADLRTGEITKTVPAHSGFVQTAVYAPDGKTLLTSSDDGTLKIWKAETGELQTVLAEKDLVVTEVAFSPDGNWLAGTGQDSLTRIWDLKSGQQTVGFFVGEKGGLTAVTPEGYYTSSKEALGTVGFRIGKRVVPFAQFDLKFNRPDLVLEKLGGQNKGLIDTLQRNYAKRLRRMNFKPEMLAADFHLPEIEVTTGNLPASTANSKLSFTVRARDAKTPLDRLNVFVNDVPVYGSAGLSLRDKNLLSADQDLTIELSPGRNRVEVAALNQAGAESLREIFEINFDTPPVKPDLYIAAIGVSEYQKTALRLNYAAKDAKDLIAELRSKTGLYANVHVRQLLDNEATRENIQSVKEWLRQSKTGDEALVFISGHGFRDEKADYYFGTPDIDPAQPSLRGLGYETLEDLLDGIPARRKLLLMDTCFAGELDKDEIKGRTIVEKAEGKVSEREVGRSSEVIRLSGEDSGSTLEATFTELRRGSGAFVIAAAGGAEFALESSKWNNGVFTYTILNGLKNGLADGNRDGEITVSELRDYVSAEVPRLTDGRQRPLARRDNLTFDYPLAYQPHLVRQMKHDWGVNSIALSPDGKRLASASTDQSVRIWDWQTGRQSNFYDESSPLIARIDWQPGSENLVYLIEDYLYFRHPTNDENLPKLPALAQENTLNVYLSRNKGEDKSIKGVNGELFDFAVSPDGKFLAAGGEEQKIFLWNMTSGKIERTLSGFSEGVMAVTWSKDGKLMAGADAGGTLKIWQSSDAKILQTVKAHEKMILSLVFEPNSNRLASAGKDAVIKIWNPVTGDRLKEIKLASLKTEAVGCLAFTSDGKFLASGHQNGLVRLWKAETGELVQTLAAHSSSVSGVTFSADNKQLISGGDSSIKVWQMRPE